MKRSMAFFWVAMASLTVGCAGYEKASAAESADETRMLVYKDPT